MKFCWMINDRIRMVDIGSDFVVAGNDVGNAVKLDDVRVQLTGI